MNRNVNVVALLKLTSVIAVALISSRAWAGTRVILSPYIAPGNPSKLYIDQFANPPSDQFYLKARFQRSWSGGAPIANQTSYNPSAYTGVGPLPLHNQRGPLGGNVGQSTYQISGNEVGILMRTWDGPHPCAGVAPTACNGFHKHTVYERNWSTFERVFTSRNPSSSLDIEADINVKHFAQWNSGTGGAPVGIVAGQLVFVIFLEDKEHHRIQYVIYAFDSNLHTNDGNELDPQLEPIGTGNNGYYLTSSFKKRRVMKYTTVDGSSAEFGNVPWASYRHFKIRITQDNLSNAIKSLNAKGGNLSPDVMNYRITLVGINQEIAYRAKFEKGAIRYDDNGDEAIMGSSVKNIKVSESDKGNPHSP
jgi:hypothetical protein